MITLAVTKDTATAELQRLLEEAKRPRAILAAAARAMRNFLVRHFRKLETENPNQLGGERQHFWLQVGRSVQNPVITETTATVAVSDPRYAFKVYGGTITAKRVNMLTIPVSPEAYGRSASVLEREEGVKLIAIGHEGRGVLAEELPAGGIKVHYVLRRSVTIPPFPGALPDMAAMSADALQHARSAAARQINPASNN